MHRTSRFWVRAVATLGLGIAVGVAASRPSNADTAGVAPPPAPLSQAKRAIRVANALKAARLPSVKMSTTQGVRVTAITPHNLGGGGQITTAGPIIFHAPSYSSDDGSYTMVGANGSTATVEMMFKTVVGSLYVLACAVSPGQAPGVKMSVGNGAAPGVEAPIEDGYLYNAFSASSTMTKLTLMASGLAATGNPSFHSCELSKVE